MSVYESIQNRPVPLGSIGIFNVVSGVESVIRRMRDWNARRRTVAELRRLSNDQLNDIGLYRAEIADVARGR